MGKTSRFDGKTISLLMGKHLDLMGKTSRFDGICFDVKQSLFFVWCLFLGDLLTGGPLELLLLLRIKPRRSFSLRFNSEPIMPPRPNSQ
jgi:hypothetical protein